MIASETCRNGCSTAAFVAGHVKCDFASGHVHRYFKPRKYCAWFTALGTSTFPRERLPEIMDDYKKIPKQYAGNLVGEGTSQPLPCLLLSELRDRVTLGKAPKSSRKDR